MSATAQLKGIAETFKHVDPREASLWGTVVTASVVGIPILLAKANTFADVLFNGAILTGCMLFGGKQLRNEWQDAKRARLVAVLKSDGKEVGRQW